MDHGSLHVPRSVFFLAIIKIHWVLLVEGYKYKDRWVTLPTLNLESYISHLTLLGPQSRCGYKPFKFQVLCPQNGTAVLKELSTGECTLDLGDTLLYALRVCGS